MYLLTLQSRKNDGAYAVEDKHGDKVLFLFEQEDDALRYAMMLEDEGSPDMHVIEVEDEVMIKTCQMHDYNYAVITPNDIVIPPNSGHDII